MISNTLVWKTDIVEYVVFATLLFIRSNLDSTTLHLECHTCVRHGTRLWHFCTYVLTGPYIYRERERERGKRLEHKRDTYLLFIFSFNLEHLSNYILFTLLNLFLTTAYPWCDGHSTSTSACGVWEARAGVQVSWR